jgi:hypothetical protein
MNLGQWNKEKGEADLVAHACNPIYLGG